MLGEQGLMGLHIPEEYGGGARARSPSASPPRRSRGRAPSTVHHLPRPEPRRLSRSSSRGNEEQKRRFLPRLASGEITAAFSLSESGSGSDAAAMLCAAVRKGDRYVVNGSKMWVTNGSHAGVITVFVTHRARPARPRA